MAALLGCIRELLGPVPPTTPPHKRKMGVWLWVETSPTFFCSHTTIAKNTHADEKHEGKTPKVLHHAIERRVSQSQCLAHTWPSKCQRYSSYSQPCAMISVSKALLLGILQNATRHQSNLFPSYSLCNKDTIGIQATQPCTMILVSKALILRNMTRHQLSMFPTWSP